MKRFLSGAIVAGMLFSFLTQGVSAESTSAEEKRRLAEAAGETTTVQPVDANVKIKKDSAVEIAKKVLEDEENYEVSNASLSPKYTSKGSAWYIDFHRKNYPYGNANVSIDADSGEILNFNMWDSYDSSKNYIAKITRAEAEVLALDFLKNKMNLNIDEFELRKEDPYTYSYKINGVKEQVIYNINYVKKVNGAYLNDCTLYVGVDGSDKKIRSFGKYMFDTSGIKFQPAENILTAEQAMEKYMAYSKLSLQYITSYEDKSYVLPAPKIKLVYLPVTSIGMMDAKTGDLVNYDGSVMKLTDTDKNGDVKPLNPDAKLGSKVITEEEAQKTALGFKEMAEKLLGVSFSNNDDSKPYFGSSNDFWNGNWYISDTKMSANMGISINLKTGHITGLNMSKYPIYSDGSRTYEINEKVTWEQGKTLAEKAIKEIIPQEYGFFADQNATEPVMSEEAKKTTRDHYYNYIRVVNGILYRDNSIGVGIDRETGAVNSFYMNWTDADFPIYENIISKDDAEKGYFESTEAVLSYFIKRTWNEKQQMENVDENARLVYNFNTKGYQYANLMIDALTGKTIDWSGKEIPAQYPSTSAEEHWAKRSAELLIAQGIIKTPYVDLESKLTRNDAVKLLSLAKGMGYYGEIIYSVSSFKDVDVGDEYHEYIENAIRHGIFTGSGEDFNGSREISKGEFVKLLVNMMGYGNIASHSSIFAVDGMLNVGTDLIGYTAICKALEVLPVKDGELFDASAAVKWGEAAAALYKALEYIK